MLNLLRKYRKNYSGEDIISARKYEEGAWTSTTEHVPNNVINNQISNRAVVFGNGVSRLDFDVKHLMAKKSGLLGADTLQSYGCNAFYRDYTPDFLVVTDRIMAKQVVDSGYIDNNIVYTRVDISLEFPRKFYLIPHDPYADSGSTAIYIAAFDGHKKVYLLGFDGQDTPGMNNNVYANTPGYTDLYSQINDDKWFANQATIFKVYNDVDFIHVSDQGTANIPEDWKYCPNLRQISHRDFVLEADL